MAYCLNVQGISAPAIRHIPFCNIVFKATGATIPSDKGTMLHYMKQRRNLGIIPGGFEVSAAAVLI
jgi:hypothetical protein